MKTSRSLDRMIQVMIQECSVDEYYVPQTQFNKKLRFSGLLLLRKISSGILITTGSSDCFFSFSFVTTRGNIILC
jgi:hypothetical protein